MLGRLLRRTGVALVIAAAFVTPVLATSTTTPASADTVVNGCTIVSNPTPTSFTNCPNTNFSGADLLGVNLDYANLTGSSFDNVELAQCVLGLPPTSPVYSCSNATFENATLSQASFTGATTTSCVSFNSTPTIITTVCSGVDLTGANLQSADLSGRNLSDVTLSSANLVGANVSGATFSASYSMGDGVVDYLGTNLTSADLAGLDLSGSDLSFATLTGANLTGAQLQNDNLSTTIDPLAGAVGGALGQANLTNANLTGANLSGATLTGATLTGANLTGTLLVPSNQTGTTNKSAAKVTWPTPQSLPGATPGSCTPPSGSAFPIGTTTVTCQVLDDNGDVATGTFTVQVTAVVKSHGHR